MTGRWIWLLPISAALVMRLGTTYEPFPTADALWTAPAAWAGGTQSSPADTLAHVLRREAPLWATGIRLADAAGDLAAAWWWLTLALSVGAAAGVFRLVRALGVQGFLLPPALAIGYGGGVGALANRSPDAALGTGFGMEALALCLLIWSYDAFVRDRAIPAGALLGAAALTHPLVLAHGIAAITIATPVTTGHRWRRLALVMLVALGVGSPAAVQLAHGALDIGAMAPAAASRLVAEGYLFRHPEAYALQGLRWEAGLARILLLLAGIAGAVSLAGGARRSAARALAGLITGHAALAAAAILCYTRRLEGPWSQSVAAYALDLTLTAPLLWILSGAAVMAAVEVRATEGRVGLAGPAVLRIALWAAAATLLATLPWSRWALAATALGLLGLIAVAAGRGRAVAGGVLGAAALGAFAWSAGRDVRYAAPDREDAELYRWARQDTPPGASFIVPPMASGFRHYTRRGVHVDHDLVPVASPRALAAWRDRLDLVARTDARAGTGPVWRRRYALERTFAVANTPGRAAELLRRLHADYLVWDARGLAISPFLPVNRPATADVAEVFRNDRYVVYALGDAGRALR